MGMPTSGMTRSIENDPLGLCGPFEIEVDGKCYPLLVGGVGSSGSENPRYPSQPEAGQRCYMIDWREYCRPDRGDERNSPPDPAVAPSDQVMHDLGRMFSCGNTSGKNFWGAQFSGGFGTVAARSAGAGVLFGSHTITLFGQVGGGIGAGAGSSLQGLYWRGSYDGFMGTGYDASATAGGFQASIFGNSSGGRRCSRASNRCRHCCNQDGHRTAPSCLLVRSRRL